LKHLVSLEPIPIHQLPYSEFDGVGSAREYAFITFSFIQLSISLFTLMLVPILAKGGSLLTAYKITNSTFLYFSKEECHLMVMKTIKKRIRGLSHNHLFNRI